MKMMILMMTKKRSFQGEIPSIVVKICLLDWDEIPLAKMRNFFD